MMDNERPAVFLTGAAGLLGEAVARFLAARYRLALVDVSLERTADLAKDIGNGAIAIACDLSQSSEASAAVAEAEATFGRIDVLVNNAGVFTTSKAEQTSDAEWERVLSINLDAAFYLCRALLPLMKARGYGRIANVCSMAMKNGGLASGTAYAVSKGALGALTFSLARESAPFGITVNGIAPAFVDGPMIWNTVPPDELEKVKSQIPVRRFCRPEEFAHCVEFLISPLSGFITGEILDLNGGLHLD